MRTAAAAALLPPLLLLLAAPAAAAPPIAASGTFASAVTSVTPLGTDAGGDRIYALTFRGAFAGTMAGDFTRESRLAIHPDGTDSFQGRTTCACTVAGRSGTLELRDQGTGVVGGAFRAQAVVVAGDGGLAGLHGQATLAGSDATGAGTYAGQVRFAP